MSSKRGRKRNDNLPPNRARDVQRAFRARRAAHLLALEQRVSELEVENAKLRKLVGWPPDDRPPLGKGPTGKDKPKPDGGEDSHAIDFFSVHDTESIESQSRTGSLSPSAIPGSSSRDYAIDPTVWEHALTMDPHDQPPDSPYQLPPMVPPVSTKPIYPSYGSALSSSLPSSSSRSPNAAQSVSAMYMNQQAGYPHASDRQHLSGSYSSPSFVARGGDVQVESPRQPYSYHQGSYQTHDPATHPHSPPPPAEAPSHSHTHTQSHLHQRDISTSFTHRRALTEQFSFGQSLHLPNPAQLQSQQNARQPDSNRVHNVGEQQQQQQHLYRITYGPDGRINSMP